jgi:hypothetical protein
MFKMSSFQMQSLKVRQKFDGGNFHLWKFKMRMMFSKHGLWKVVDGSATLPSEEVASADYNDKEMKAFAFFVNISQMPNFGRGTNSHVPFAMSEPYSSCITASHLLSSSECIASHIFNGSSRQATLARSTSCWGRMWFFHHSPSGRRSLKGYLRSSKGCPSCSPFVLASLNGVEGVDEHPRVGGAS